MKLPSFIECVRVIENSDWLLASRYFLLLNAIILHQTSLGIITNEILSVTALSNVGIKVIKHIFLVYKRHIERRVSNVPLHLQR